MKISLSSLVLAVFILMSTLAQAQNKAVIIPLSSNKAAGSNGQVQYNDNGIHAGAEIYYDKTTKKLESHVEVRVTDEIGNTRLWGEGRPGVSMLDYHDVSAGYCETPQGIKFALSNQYSNWSNAAAACPAGKWVCTLEETGNQTCPTVASVTSLTTCDGSSGPTGEIGWLADALGSKSGAVKIANPTGDPNTGRPVCESMFVWCCWE